MILLRLALSLVSYGVLQECEKDVTLFTKSIFINELSCYFEISQKPCH